MLGLKPSKSKFMNDLPAVAIEYVKIGTELIDRSQMIFKLQGQPVELSEKMSIENLALTFALAFEFSSETVLRLNNKELVLLFAHHEQGFLRPEEVNKTIFEEIIKSAEKAKFVSDIAMPPPEIIINLEKEWKKIKKGKDEILKTKEFIKSMPKILKPAINLIMEGEVPALAFLSMIYFSRPYGHNIFYKDKKRNNIKLFSKII